MTAKGDGRKVHARRYAKERSAKEFGCEEREHQKQDDANGKTAKKEQKLIHGVIVSPNCHATTSTIPATSSRHHPKSARVCRPR